MSLELPHVSERLKLDCFYNEKWSSSTKDCQQNEKQERNYIENVQINTKPKPLSQQDLMRRSQVYQFVYSNMEATGNIIEIQQLFSLVDKK